MIDASFTGHTLPIYANWSQFLGGVTLFGLVTAWYHHHRCHVKRCKRLAWHPHPRHGHPVCRRHHPHHGEPNLHDKVH